MPSRHVCTKIQKLASKCELPTAAGTVFLNNALNGKFPFGYDYNILPNSSWYPGQFTLTLVTLPVTNQSAMPGQVDLTFRSHRRKLASRALL